MGGESSEGKRRLAPSLSLWVAGTLIVALLALVGPGLWLTAQLIESAVMSEEMRVLGQAHDSWTQRINDRLTETEASAARYGRILSMALQDDPVGSPERFDAIVGPAPDGGMVSRKAGFAPGRDAVVWLPAGYPLDDEEKLFLLEAKRVTELYSAGAPGEPISTWIIPRRNGLVMYWPSYTSYIDQVDTTVDFASSEWMALVLPANNPEGKPRWTPTSYDPAAREWMVSVVAPFFRGGVFAGSSGHDVTVNAVMTSFRELTAYQGALHLLVQRDGTLLISSAHQDRIHESKGTLKLAGLGDAGLSRTFDEAKQSSGGAARTVIDGEKQRVLVAAHIPGPDWYLITEVPQGSLASVVKGSYRRHWLAGAAVILAVVMLPVLVVMRVTLPSVRRLVAAAGRFQAGDVEQRFGASAVRELVQIGEALNAMAEKAAEDQRRLADQGRQIRLLLDSTAEAIVGLDREGRCTFVNQAGLSLFGLTEPELLSKPIGLLEQPSSPGETAPQRGSTFIHDSLARGAAAHAEELILRRNDGTRVVVECWSHPIRQDDGVIGTVVTAVDISARRAAQHALRTSEERLKLVIEGSNDGFWDWDLATEVLELSGRWAEMLGERVEDLEPHARTWEERMHPEDQAASRALLDEHLAGLTPHFEVEQRMRCKSGEWKWMLTRGKVVARDEAGKPLRMAGTQTDISERKRSEALRKKTEELEALSLQIQEANRLKSEFLANMSHELRTPLNAIIGFAELMYDGKVGPLSEEHKEYMGDILSSGQHLLQLINDILDLAKIEAGKTDLRPEPVDPGAVVLEIRDVLRDMAARRGIRIETDVDTALGRVVVDVPKLKQILYNYLSNGLKFAREGGRVAVRVRGEGPDMFRIEVEDEGMGIRPEDLEQLFVAFQQLDASASKRHQGSGLGLALTKRIVEAHGGRVGVVSSVGQGSTFFAVLPRVTEKTSEPEVRHRTTPAEAAPPGAPAVLVIEDDEQERSWLCRTLAEAGYAVELVATGAEALALCQKRAFAAITLDLLLDGESGLDLLRKIRAEGPNATTPVIAVTLTAEQGLASGFAIHEVLIKPLQPDALLASLRRAGVSPDPGCKILVIDDDPRACKIMAATLTQLGYQAICSHDGAHGLGVLVEERPAAVVLDLLMPGMDGFEFLERFRELGGGPRVPVFVWTVKDLTAEERTRLRASAHAIFQKGRQGVNVLLEEIRRVCAPHRAADAESARPDRPAPGHRPGGGPPGRAQEETT
ncbi:response regulator [Sorangium sp. So ce131]|uniref:response regulator n=1 Tax=Sorangium sp. So ce131 TaxID=3133282 RepID=UPI003F630773